MDWQLFIVAALIIGAACYLARQTWRTWSASRKGCAGGCGCHGKAAPVGADRQVALISAEQLRVRPWPHGS
jgi:hypothetical protein